MTTTTSSQRVYLHVGVPRSGTTYLSTSLLRNRKSLLDAGVLHPAAKDRMFLAALDVRGTHGAWGLSRSDVRDSWDDLARRARRHDGVTVLGHELLAAATPRQVTAAMTMLRGLEVHVVVTARDPARQAVAAWQDSIRAGSSLTFEQFRRTVLDGSSETDGARRFRAAQDLPDVLGRWGTAVPSERVHVVCCPPEASPKALLWQRFAAVVGFDATQFQPVRSTGLSVSLGRDETDLLRRVNVALEERVTAPDHGSALRQGYAQGLLGTSPSARPVAPAAMHDDLTVTARRWVKEVDRAGYAVSGELADLLPVAPHRATPHPDVADHRAQLATSISATAELLVELQQLRAQIGRLENEKAALKSRRRLLKRRLAAATGE